jgi:hypothetical protein
MLRVFFFKANLRIVSFNFNTTRLPKIAVKSDDLRIVRARLLNFVREDRFRLFKNLDFARFSLKLIRLNRRIFRFQCESLIFRTD